MSYDWMMDVHVWLVNVWMVWWVVVDCVSQHMIAIVVDRVDVLWVHVLCVWLIGVCVYGWMNGC